MDHKMRKYADQEYGTYVPEPSINKKVKRKSRFPTKSKPVRKDEAVYAKLENTLRQKQMQQQQQMFIMTSPMFQQQQMQMQQVQDQQLQATVIDHKMKVTSQQPSAAQPSFFPQSPIFAVMPQSPGMQYPFMNGMESPGVFNKNMPWAYQPSLQSPQIVESQADDVDNSDELVPQRNTRSKSKQF